jgi:magnesium chelatase family protein
MIDPNRIANASELIQLQGAQRMFVVVVYSRAVIGVDAPLVSVETHLSSGLPASHLVGLPETAFRESKERIRSAIITSGYDFPTRRITVDLAPADLPKHGTRFDLAIAHGILAASNQIPIGTLEHTECIAELALGGSLRPVRGILPAALAARATSRSILVAGGDEPEAALVRDLDVYDADNLDSVCQHLSGGVQLTNATTTVDGTTQTNGDPDLADIHAQYQGKRAMEIAASGGHNLLTIGPPGTGKTMLATRLPGLLPSLSEDEAFESAAVLSSSNLGFDMAHWRTRPFRSPHHTCSGVVLIGGHCTPRPGEVSLTHRGILFLDELPEFERRTLAVLREPLETGRVTISRAARSQVFLHVSN